MQYIKGEEIPYNLHIIKTQKFKTVTIKINFRRKAVKKELTIRKVLGLILLESSANYETNRLLKIRKEELYSPIISQSTSIKGEYSLLSFSVHFLNEKYTEENMQLETIKFFFEIIFNPHFEDQMFILEKLENVKSKLRDYLKEKEKDPSVYANLKLLNVMGEDEYFSFDANGYLEDLESITVKDLSDYYKQLMHSDIMDIFVIGEVEERFIKKTFQDKIPLNTIKRETAKFFIEHDKIRKRARKLKEPFDATQSRLVIGIKLDKMTNFEKRYVLPIYNIILGDGPDSLLFNVVREKHSLCYSISSGMRILQSLLIINVGLNKEEAEKALRLIRKEIKLMTKILDEEQLVKAKTYYINNLKQINNNPLVALNYYLNKVYYNDEDYLLQIKNIEKITSQMIMDFAKKIKVDTIYLLEGGE